MSRSGSVVNGVYPHLLENLRALIERCPKKKRTRNLRYLDKLRILFCRIEQHPPMESACIVPVDVFECLISGKTIAQAGASAVGTAFVRGEKCVSALSDGRTESLLCVD